MNKQNGHVLAQLNKALTAIKQLAKNGVTVLSVDLEKQKPRIEIQTPSLKHIGETLIVRGTQAGIRQEIKYSTFAGCTVFWKM